MNFDDHGNISEKLLPHAADFRSGLVFNSTLIILSIAVLGEIGFFYISNYLLWINFANRDRAYWELQAYIFAGYGILSLIAVFSGNAVDRITQRYSFLSLGWCLTVGGMGMAATTSLTVVLLISPIFPPAVGIAAKDSLPTWIIINILALASYSIVLVRRAGITQREQAMRVLLDTDALGIALDRAELSMLEAQVEPHFLFNTLAHVKRHYRIDPVTADKMLSALIDYLNRALPALRRADWTVNDELALIRAYLDILIDRFGTRLRFDVTVPDESLRAKLPALTVATLVENAVRHGIAPQIEGGTVSIVVSVDATALRIEVSDDGAGLKMATGSGIGLITARARLQNAFGAQAMLSIGPLSPKGVRASITIPLRK
jgi:hypothetical protein